MILYSVILLISTIWLSTAEYADLPCNARSYTNKSVVCVCNTTYCDTVIRETPVSGQYFAYTSSLSGARFNKTNEELVVSCDTETYDVTLELTPSKTYQSIIGFGGAVTDSAAINYVNLNNTQLMEYFVESYCSTKGLEYNMLRVPIGGSDFSTRAYGYNMLPVNDTTLSNFSLTYEDYDYKLPLIKACMAASNTSINMFASLWSPPAWMKSNDAYTGFGWLKDEYFQTLADYFYKFMEAYEEEGVSMWGVTLTNEPVSGVLNAYHPNSLGWRLDTMASWLVNNLGPTLRNSTSFSNVKIMAVDDNRFMIPLYFNLMVRTFPKCLDYIDGVAVHMYSDKSIPPQVTQKAMEKYPTKFLLNTEGCIIPKEEKPLVVADYGSWVRAEKYIKNILENVNYNTTGWVDWNMALDTLGGPTWLGSGLDAPIIVDAENSEFIKQPMFYAMGHFSKFIPRNSTRIEVTASCDDVLNVAFLTPDNNIVVIVYNEGSEAKSVNIRLDGYDAVITLSEKTITTLEFPVPELYTVDSTDV